MTDATMRPESVTHTFSMTVEVDPHWVEYLTQSSDIFHPQCAGYWAFGVACNDQLGWLLYEKGDGGRSTEDPDAVAAWRAGEPLPAGYYRLDRAAALRAWEEGVKRWGVDWYAQVDGMREDVVVQLALLGEVRYG